MSLKLAMLFCVAILATACGNEKDQGTSGRAKVVLSDATGALLAADASVRVASNTCPGGNSCATETQLAKFELKVMGVGIHTHADTTQGYGSAIYSHSACPAPQLETEINGKLFPYVGFSSCSDASISTYFDLKSPTVNADLNSQYLPIAPGSYKFGTMSFCQGGAASQNYRVTFTNDAGLPAELRNQTVSMTVGTCGITTPEMSPPMEVSEGETVLVTLDYDLTNTVYYRSLGAGESAGVTCGEVDAGGGIRYSVCINPPTIGATFTRQ